MTHALVLAAALGIGVVGGLRALTPPAVVAWAGLLGWLPLAGTWAHWLAHPAAVTVLTVLLAAELVADGLPATPLRTVPVQFLTRIVAAGFAGAVVGAGWHYTVSAIGAGMIGAVLGTLAGYEFRRALTGRTDDHDLPVALTEDAIAVLGGFAVVALAAAI